MNANPFIKHIYSVVFGDITLDDKEEVKENIRIIEDALTTNVIETVAALFNSGPLFDGDVPSKAERDWLLLKGYCAKIVFEKEDGYNALTNKGAWLYRCQNVVYSILLKTPR